MRLQYEGRYQGKNLFFSRFWICARVFSKVVVCRPHFFTFVFQLPYAVCLGQEMMARRTSFYTRFHIGKYRAPKKLEQDELVKKMLKANTDLSRKRTKLKRLQDRGRECYSQAWFHKQNRVYNCCQRLFTYMLWRNFDFPLFQLLSLPLNSIANGKIPIAIQETGWSEVGSADLFMYVCVLTNYFLIV